jgi:hypothetical protein
MECKLNEYLHQWHHFVQTGDKNSACRPLGAITFMCSIISIRHVLLGLKEALPL